MQAFRMHGLNRGMSYNYHMKKMDSLCCVFVTMNVHKYHKSFRMVGCLSLWLNKIQKCSRSSALNVRNFQPTRGN